jgi:hypothetical protein
LQVAPLLAPESAWRHLPLLSVPSGRAGRAPGTASVWPGSNIGQLNPKCNTMRQSASHGARSRHFPHGFSVMNLVVAQ